MQQNVVVYVLNAVLKVYKVAHGYLFFSREEWIQPNIFIMASSVLHHCHWLWSLIFVYTLHTVFFIFVCILLFFFFGFKNFRQWQVWKWSVIINFCWVCTFVHWFNSYRFEYVGEIFVVVRDRYSKPGWLSVM